MVVLRRAHVVFAHTHRHGGSAADDGRNGWRCRNARDAGHGRSQGKGQPAGWASEVRRVRWQCVLTLAMFEFSKVVTLLGHEIQDIIYCALVGPFSF